MTAPCLPSEMPDLRLTLLDKWDTPGWQNAALEATIRGDAAIYGYKPNRRQAEEEAAVYIRWERNLLRNADLYWVGQEMCDLLYHAATTIPGDVRVNNLTIPADNGFVVFEKPWVSIDAYDPDYRLKIDAIGWAWSNLPDEGGSRNHSMTCLSLTMYCCHDFEDGMEGKEMEWAISTGAITEGRSGGRIGTDERGNVAWKLTGRAWSPAGRTDWPIDADLGSGNPHEPERFKASRMEDRQLLAALFTLLSSHVADVREERPDRPTRRRTERRQAKPGNVNLVYLRRPEHDDDDDEPEEGGHRKVEWSHRWMVSAHIRNQPCGPGRRERRLVLIAPYPKGPPDKPMIVKESVKVWVR